jgi:ribonucleoside-diphosphate reductase alpha chain
MTGIAAGRVNSLDVERAARVVLEENARIAAALGIRPSARCTTVKPAGTTSLLLGCSSGIHAYHAPSYLRRIVINNNEPILAYLKHHLPELVERSVYQPEREHVFCMPMKAPTGSVTREQEDALALLERVRDTYRRWILPGHRSGENTNNISCTVSVKEHEWGDVGHWMWRHRHDYVALSVLPHDGGGYPQAPFEACSQEAFAEHIQSLRPIDFSQITETQDHTARQEAVACAGAACEIL